MSEEKTFTQEELNTLIGEARIKAREKAKSEFSAQSTKDKEAAERSMMASKEEWQKLAATHEARVTELEPLEQRVQAYETVIDGMLVAKVKELGDNAKKAVAGLPEAMSPLGKLEWLNDNSNLFESIEPIVGTPKGGERPPKDSRERRKKVKL